MALSGGSAVALSGGSAVALSGGSAVALSPVISSLDGTNVDLLDELLDEKTDCALVTAFEPPCLRGSKGLARRGGVLYTCTRTS